MGTRVATASSCRAFTLVEFMVVVAVMAIAAAMLVPAVIRARERVREQKVENKAKESLARDGSPTSKGDVFKSYPKADRIGDINEEEVVRISKLVEYSMPDLNAFEPVYFKVFAGEKTLRFRFKNKDGVSMLYDAVIGTDSAKFKKVEEFVP